MLWCFLHSRHRIDVSSNPPNFRRASAVSSRSEIRNKKLEKQLFHENIRERLCLVGRWTQCEQKRKPKIVAMMSTRAAHLAPLLWLTPATDFCCSFPKLRYSSVQLSYSPRLEGFWLKKCLAWPVVGTVIVRHSTITNRRTYIRCVLYGRVCLNFESRERQLWDWKRKNELKCSRRSQHTPDGPADQQSYSDMK